METDLDGTFVILARWYARAGEEAAVAAALARMVGPSRAEPGVLDWRVHRDPGDPRVFLLYERYRDRAAFDAHLSAPHTVQHATGDAVGRLESRERTELVLWEPGM